MTERYCDIEPMCRPQGIGVRGCPFDGLGCVTPNECKINENYNNPVALLPCAKKINRIIVEEKKKLSDAPDSVR